MTIDERVAKFAKFKDSAAWDTYLKAMLREVARDQRHACAEAILEINSDSPVLQRAHQQAMNAEIK